MIEMRAVLRFFVLLLVAPLVMTCATAAPPPAADAAPPRGMRAAGGGPCANGEGQADRQAPIVCVDDRGETLSVSPDPIVLHDKNKDNGQPVTMQWFTRSGRNDLQIEIEEGCLTEVKCNGKGKCTAKARDILGETRCKYDVWTDKHPRLDPDVIVTPCC